MSDRQKETSFEMLQLMIFHHAEGKSQCYLYNFYIQNEHSTVRDIIKRCMIENRVELKTKI